MHRNLDLSKISPKFGIPPLAPTGQKKSDCVDCALAMHYLLIPTSPSPVQHVLIDCLKFNLIRLRLSLPPLLPNLLGESEATVSWLFTFLKNTTYSPKFNLTLPSLWPL